MIKDPKPGDVVWYSLGGRPSKARSYEVVESFMSDEAICRAIDEDGTRSEHVSHLKLELLYSSEDEAKSRRPRYCVWEVIYYAREVDKQLQLPPYVADPRTVFLLQLAAGKLASACFDEPTRIITEVAPAEDPDPPLPSEV